MALDPPLDGWTDISLENLILRIQDYAGPKGYAVVKARTKQFKSSGLDRKVWIRCDRGGEEEKYSKSMGKRITSSRLNKCLFMLIAQRTNTGELLSD